MPHEDSPFPFLTIKEAWEYFNRASRLHLANLVRQRLKDKPEQRAQLKKLRNKGYCARLLYLLTMFELEGDEESEFDIDWAMLIAKPISAQQARRSLNDLIALELLDESIVRSRRSGGHGSVSFPQRTPPPRKGGETNSQTKFEFD